MQFLAGLMVNRKREQKMRIVLDVEDYRKKREQSLEALALRLSEKVKQTQKNVIMRPMNPQERRIVHTILQEDPQLVTYSMGDEPNRKVVIALKKYIINEETGRNARHKRSEAIQKVVIGKARKRSVQYVE